MVVKLASELIIVYQTHNRNQALKLSLRVVHNVL